MTVVLDGFGILIVSVTAALIILSSLAGMWTAPGRIFSICMMVWGGFGAALLIALARGIAA